MKELKIDLVILAILNSLKDQNIQEDLVSWPPIATQASDQLRNSRNKIVPVAMNK